MTNLPIYIIQVIVAFSLLYVVYRIVWSRLTFHSINRCLLLSLLPISILLPLINGLFPSIPQVVIDIPLYESIGFNEIGKFSIQEVSMQNSAINYWLIATVIYGLGVIFSLAKLLFNIKRIISIKQNATIYQKKGYKIMVAGVSEIFSFFNWIFVPTARYGHYDNAIIEHEKSHIKLKHSIDIIITELYISMFWFNPFVYFYRKSLKSVHEFQADNRVLNKRIKTSDYLQVLLQNLDIKSPNTIYNYFNYPILKRRIDMLTKNKSSPLAKLNYLLLLPLFSLLLFAFTKPNTANISLIMPFNELISSDSLPSIFPVKDKSKEDITSFFGIKRKHPKIKKGTIHGGIDIRAKTGTPIIATANGIISKASLEGNWGNLIVISHADGYETWYAHLNRFNTRKKQVVKKGEVIGYVGNTGVSTGSHLHYEVRHKGERLNPIDYIGQ